VNYGSGFLDLENKLGTILQSEIFGPQGGKCMHFPGAPEFLLNLAISKVVYSNISMEGTLKAALLFEIAIKRRYFYHDCNNNKSIAA